MNKAELTIMDCEIVQQINLLRFNAGERQKVLKILAALQKELKGKLYSDLTDFSRARVNKLIKESTAIINNHYTDMGDVLNVKELAAQVTKNTAGSIVSIGLDASLPTAAVMKSLTDDLLLQGSPLSGWWSKQASDLSFRYANAVRQGVVQGETLQQMIVRVFGSKRLGTPGIGFPDSVLRRNASALVHDSIMKVSGEAKMAVYEANQDIMKGYYWLSSLDGIICIRCVARSGAKWDLKFQPMGSPALPFVRQGDLHVSCRCLVLPILKSYAELGSPDIPEPGKGTRASDLGQVDADLSFSGFLERHSKEYQDNLLGPGRADLWRRKVITLSQLLDFQGNPLTLAQLRAR